MQSLDSSIDEYLGFWGILDTERRNWLHPADYEIVERSTDNATHDLQSYFQSQHWGSYERNIVHSGLIPQPHHGDLRGARVVVLYANPGFGADDYWGEYAQPEFRRRVHQNLLGQFDMRFPYLFLDPSLCWTGGFKWSTSRFGAVIAWLAKERCAQAFNPIVSAHEFLSQRLVVLETFPYHSRRGVSSAIVRKLPSFAAARRLVDAFIEHHVPVIVARSHDLWGLAPSERIHVCPRRRSQSFNPESAAGRFLLQALEG